MSERRATIAVVGAGLMGTSIGLDWARAGFDVSMYDSDPDRVESLTRRAREIGQALVEGEVITANELNLAVARLTATTRDAAAPGRRLDPAGAEGCIAAAAVRNTVIRL